MKSTNCYKICPLVRIGPNLIEQEILKLGSVKVSFGLKVNFEIERNGETQEMSHYFKEDQPHVFNRDNKELIEQKYEEFMGRIKGEIENWSLKGSGWEVESIEIAYVNVAKYQPLRGGTYLPLPADLAKKKAIINVKNKDNQCLKWALRAALFPPKDGRHAQRPSKYPVNDGINYEGIDFPTPVKQIDKLEKQNPNLAINVFGWEKDTVIVYRISSKEKSVERINLMLIESRDIQHYCWVKRESALLFDKAINNKTFYCMRCLTRFTRAHMLVEHEKYCNGVNGRPTKIDMPEEGENILAFQNHQKQMKAPYVIYADFESLVKKIQGCERDPEKKYKSYTEKTEWHEACGYCGDLSTLLPPTDKIVWEWRDKKCQTIGKASSKYKLQEIQEIAEQRKISALSTRKREKALAEIRYAGTVEEWKREKRQIEEKQ